MKLKYAGILVLLLLFSNVTNGQDFWEQLSFPDSSSIFSIAVNVQQEIYIGSGSGIYSSDSDGSNWKFLGLENRIVHSIAINSNGDIYAGTSQSPQIDGLYRSSDGGETWESVLPDIGVYGNILALLVDGDTLFASLWMGGAAVVRSTNNGLTWELVFYTENTSEYATDIVKSNSGDIYLSLTAFQENMGGVYKSEDGGDNWEFIGLFNYMVSSLAINDSNDVFAGSWGELSDDAWSGLYVLRHGELEWETLLTAPQVSDIVINSENHIYLAGSGPNGVVRSLDNGENFELINDGLPEGVMRNLFVDDYHYIYVTNLSTLAKSINPTVSIFEEFSTSPMNNWSIYPNPTHGILNIAPKNDNHDYKIKNVVVYNLFGGTVKFWNSIPDETCTINLKGLATGTYFLEINSSNYRTITKIIIN